MIVASRDSHWSPAAALTLAAVLLALEIIGTVLLCVGWQWPPLLLHLATSIAANVIVWRRGAVASAPIATLRTAAMLLPFLGPVAPLAAVAILLGQVANRSVPPDAATWHEHLFPNLAADPLNDRMDAISRRQPPRATGEDVESFYDVLRWGTLPEREHVLSLISRSFRAEFAPVLRKALASDDIGLRAQAAAGLSLLESRTTAGLSALNQAHREAAAGFAREQIAIELAYALADAAHSGLYDELRSVEMRREIVNLLLPIFDRRSDDPALGALLGRTMIHLGELDDAITTLARSVDASGAAGELTDTALGWLLEGLYRHGDFARLGAVLKRRRDQAETLVARDGPLAPALTFWGATT